MSEITRALESFGVIPVIVIDDASAALPLADALADGGLPCAEVTLRTTAGIAAIREIASQRADVIVGAGTVLTLDLAMQAIDAGAEFIVTPGFNPVIVDYCLEQGIAVYPGVCTPSEIDMALQRGLNVLKFFPAEAIGGLPLLKAIAAPYAAVRFIPTGGITIDNLPAYLAFPSVLACGGSWLAPAAAIAQRSFDVIREATARTVAHVREIRKIEA